MSRPDVGDQPAHRQANKRGAARLAAVQALYQMDVAGESSRALMDIALRESIAIGNGILTTENEEQAWTRARKTEGDKGGFAARAALTMIALRERLGA